MLTILFHAKSTLRNNKKLQTLRESGLDTFFFVYPTFCKMVYRSVIQWTRVLYSVVITHQSNPPISQFNSPCTEFTSVWSMFVYMYLKCQTYQGILLVFKE